MGKGQSGGILNRVAFRGVLKTKVRWGRFFGKESGRGGQIRTDDIRVPNAALYQAELRPVHGRTLVESAERIKKFFNEISLILILPTVMPLFIVFNGCSMRSKSFSRLTAAGHFR